MHEDKSEEELSQEQKEFLLKLRKRQEMSNKTRVEKEVNWILLSPLAFAPLLPLIRIGFRRQPRIRDPLFKFTLGAAFMHSTALLAGFYDKPSPQPNSIEAVAEDEASS